MQTPVESQVNIARVVALKNKDTMNDSIAVIGGGPAGLMAAEVLSARGLRVEVYDAMPSTGRKFLMAGKGGLNLTHAEPLHDFLTRYGERRAEMERLIGEFTPDDIRAWAQGLGIETFVGTSRRVFPVGMKASPLLRAWLKRLDEAGVTFHVRHKWLGWNADGSLRFATPTGEKGVTARAVVLALGGGSWARLGSDGTWVEPLRKAGVAVRPLRPANCGFEVAWSAAFRERFEGHPLKAVVLRFESFERRGEFVVTREGIEGSLVYAASALLRDAIQEHGSAIITLDLAPDRTLEWLANKLSKPRGTRSLSGYLERTVGLKGVKAGLVRELVPPSALGDAKELAAYMKYLPIRLRATGPLEKAISSAGGVAFEALDENLMVRAMPGVFCAGEMLDWEAPTGGYLLTGCFASGRAAGMGILKWLDLLKPQDRFEVVGKIDVGVIVEVAVRKNERPFFFGERLARLRELLLGG